MRRLGTRCGPSGSDPGPGRGATPGLEGAAEPTRPPAGREHGLRLDECCSGAAFQRLLDCSAPLGLQTAQTRRRQCRLRLTGSATTDFTCEHPPSPKDIDGLHSAQMTRCCPASGSSRLPRPRPRPCVFGSEVHSARQWRYCRLQRAPVRPDPTVRVWTTGQARRGSERGGASSRSVSRFPRAASFMRRLLSAQRTVALTSGLGSQPLLGFRRFLSKASITPAALQPPVAARPLEWFARPG